MSLLSNTFLACHLLTVSLAVANVASAATPSERQHWAYPQGVIVTAKVTPPARLGNGPQHDELEMFGKAARPGFSTCLANLRDKRPDLANGTRIIVGILVRLTALGSVDHVEVEKTPEPELIECAARAMVVLQDIKMTPLAKPRSITVRVALDGLLLSDDEAKGRGFLYYQAKTRWDTVLPANNSWFQCKVDTDCVATAEGCAPIAVNKDFLAALLGASESETDWTACKGDSPAPLGQAFCKARRCALKPAKA